jgi:hypothetical protein
MVEITEAQIDVALERGRGARANEPRGTGVRYDPKAGRVIVELSNGCIFAFPPRLAQGLEDATEAEIAQVEMLGAGVGLHWESLDVDLSIPDLLAGLFGTKSYLARQAGLATSQAKAAASRANGARGGRPRKSA